MLVVLIGPDGCGKTTVANGVLSSQQIANVFKSIYYYHTRFPFLPTFKQISYFFRLIEKDKLISEGKERRLEPRSYLNAIVHTTYYGIGNVVAHFWILKEKYKGDSLILFDRYFFEYLIQPEFSKCPRWIIKILYKFMPKPEAIIFLRNNAKEIHKRKNELPITELSEQLQSCQKIADTFSHTYIVDTKDDISTVIQKVEQIIVKQLK